MLEFWGKARPSETGGPTWHPAAYHCLDVGAVAFVLLRDGVSRPPPPWDGPELRISIAALIALHDVGKFTRPFQIKRPDFWPPVLGRMEATPGPSHDTAGFVLLQRQLAGELDPLLLDWARYDRVPVLAALCGHHGRPPQDCEQLAPKAACSPCIAAAQEFVRGVLAALSSPPLPSMDGRPALAWWLAGLTVLADWIGSAEGWFPYRAPDLDLSEYWHTVALPQAAAAVTAAGVRPSAVRASITLADLVGRDVPASPVQALARTLDLGADGPALVLVVDAAHAYDSYMREELLRLVEFQAGLGGSTVVLSATLPQATRRKLAGAYTRGTGLRPPRPVAVAYPLVTVLHRSGMEEVPCESRPGLARRVQVERLVDVPAAIARIIAAARAGQAVAWIRNAVDDVAEAHAGLAAAGVDATMFHARFAMGDRLGIEERVMARFGRGGTDRSGVVVASQVIEQSLDIDFDLLVTDLAPMDLMIQRAGRL